jgi:hypothetical protein
VERGILNNIDNNIDISKGFKYIQLTMREALGPCPVCGGELTVTEYCCEDCGVSLKGQFKRCDICQLPKELLHFVRVFLKCEGNMKEVEKMLGLSYPTIKSRLSKINQYLSLQDFNRFMEGQDRLELLRRFKEGEVSLDDVLDKI